MMNKSYVQSLARCILVDSLPIPSLIFRARTHTFFSTRVKAEFSARAGLQVPLYFLYFLYFKTFPIFPCLVCKCPIIPIIPSENKKYTEVHELLLVECDKDSEFFGPSETKTGNDFIISARKCT